jgi:hypothetical protein
MGRAHWYSGDMPISSYEAVLYHIELQGELDHSWSEEFRGLSIEHSRRADGQIVSALSGKFVDQAALYGVLNLAYSLGMPILCIHFLGKADPHASSKS